MRKSETVNQQHLLGFFSVTLLIAASLGCWLAFSVTNIWVITLLLLLIIFGAVVTAFKCLLTQYIEQRIAIFTAHCLALGNGMLNQRLDLRAGDSFDELAVAINRMSAQLETRRHERLHAEMEAEWAKVKLEVKLSEQTKEMLKLNDRLQAALGASKSSGDLLHICAECKMVRDKDGFLHNIEDYMEAQFGVRISHGLCPGCMNTLYPFMKGVSLAAPLSSME